MLVQMYTTDFFSAIKVIKFVYVTPNQACTEQSLKRYKNGWLLHVVYAKSASPNQ